MKYKKPSFGNFIMSLLAGLITGVLVMAAINAAFDPLHILRPPAAQDYYDSESRYAMPGLMLHNTSPAAVVGSSVVQDFDQAYYKEKTGQSLGRFFLTGGTAYEQRRMIETLLQSPAPPKTIIWGVAPNSFFYPELNSIRWTSFPEDLFTARPSLLQYLFSFETFYRLIRQVPARLKAESQSPEQRFLELPGDRPFGRESIYGSYCGRGMDERLARLEEYDYSRMEEQIKANLLPVIAAYPDVQFMLFLPPYSLVQFAEYDRVGVLEKVVKFREALASLSAPYENTALYDFQSDIAMISNDADHRDSIHYGPQTTRRIIDSVLADQHRADAQTIGDLSQKLVEAVHRKAPDIWQDIALYCQKSGQPVLAGSEVEVQKLGVHELNRQKAQPE
jgi:hypothetical protein